MCIFVAAAVCSSCSPALGRRYGGRATAAGLSSKYTVQRRPTYKVPFLGDGSLWILGFGVPSKPNHSSGPLKSTLPGPREGSSILNVDLVVVTAAVPVCPISVGLGGEPQTHRYWSKPVDFDGNLVSVPLTECPWSTCTGRLRKWQCEMVTKVPCSLCALSLAESSFPGQAESKTHCHVLCHFPSET